MIYLVCHLAFFPKLLLFITLGSIVAKFARCKQVA